MTILFWLAFLVAAIGGAWVITYKIWIKAWGQNHPTGVLFIIFGYFIEMIWGFLIWAIMGLRWSV